MTLQLPPEVEGLLRAEASRRGVDPAQFAARLIVQGLSLPPGNQAVLDLLAQWDREESADGPAEAARASREFDQFRQSINESRAQSEGPSARKVYP